MLLLVWTVTPLALYALACVVSVAVTFRTDRIGHITSVFLGVLSLVHTLICVEMFEIFDCSRYLIGTDGDGSSVHKSYLKSDHSIDCDHPFHEKFQNLTSFFIVVYVAILPIAMLVQKSRQKEKRGMLRMLESPYKQSFWFFDSLDLYYRLSMTGFLMVVYRNSPSMRMVASLFVSFLMASIVIVRPFVNDSHNRILIVGQFCVAITVAAGYVTSTFDKNEYLTGSMLCVVNSIVVVVAFWQSRNERLHAIVDALRSKPPRPIDADEFETLWMDSGRGPLCNAMLASGRFCLEVVVRSGVSEEVADQHWQYLVSILLPLKRVDGGLVWEEPIPTKTVNWYSLIDDTISRNLTALNKAFGVEAIPLHKGWLLKRNRTTQAFRRRFFILVKRPKKDGPSSEGEFVLLWRTSEDLAEGEYQLGNDAHRGSLDLGHITSVEAADSDRRLEISCIKKTFVLCAETEKDYRQWRSLLLCNNRWKLRASSDDAVRHLSQRFQNATMPTDLEGFKNAAKLLLGPLYSPETASDVFAAMLRKEEEVQVTEPTLRTTNFMEDTVYDEENPMVESVGAEMNDNPMLRRGFGAPALPVDSTSDQSDAESESSAAAPEAIVSEDEIKTYQPADTQSDNGANNIAPAAEMGSHLTADAEAGETTSSAEGFARLTSDAGGVNDGNNGGNKKGSTEGETGSTEEQTVPMDDLPVAEAVDIEEIGTDDMSGGLIDELVDAINEKGLSQDEAHDMMDRVTKDDSKSDAHIVVEMLEALQTSDEDEEIKLEISTAATEKRASVTAIEHGDQQRDDGIEEIVVTKGSTERATALSLEHDTHNPMRGEETAHLPPENDRLAPVTFNEGLKMLVRGIVEGPIPNGFDILRILGADYHRIIIGQQGEAAASFMADPVWGGKLKSLEHPEVTASMQQQVAIAMADNLKNRSRFAGFETFLDEEVLPALMCAISRSARDCFQEKLLAAAPGATTGDVDSQILLKVGPIKRLNRVAVKIGEYREDKGEEHWPHSRFVTDILRASYICRDAKSMVEAFEGLSASPYFRVVRLKNKIGECRGPFNLHVNVLFEPPECDAPILCEVQFYPEKVFAMQHRQHLLYELKRATEVKDLIP